MAAEGTYEAIRRAVLTGRPRSTAEGEQLVLAALAKRRSWHRTNERFFEFRFGGRANTIEVPNPFDANEFFRRITHAEIETFFGNADEVTRKHLHEIGQRELERLLQRDR